MDTLLAKAYCTDMDGEGINFTLWEDDAVGFGHHPINEKNKINDTPISAIVKKGTATARFNMAQYTLASMIANAQIAKGDKDEGENHEYYVTAEYFGKLEASNNVNLRNPDYKNNTKEPQKPSTSQKQANKNPTPVKTPSKGSYKVPISSGAKTKSPDAKAKILKVSFTDYKGNPISEFKTSHGVIAKIETQNMIGKSIKLTIWEEDPVFDDEIWSELVKITQDVNYKGIPITDAMWKKGEDGGDGTTQEYFLEVEYAEEIMKSSVVKVNKEVPKIKPETGRSISSVGKSKDDEKPSENKCPNCEKDITLEQIKAICVDKKGNSLIKDDKMIVKSLPYLNQYKNKVGINTCVSKAHFIAQICQESKFYILQEAFKYSDSERMRRLFYSYFKQFGSLENQRREARRLSQMSFDKERWPEVANAIYGKTHSLGKKHINADDGWRYSGKGFKQITWMDNYENLQKYVKNVFELDVNWLHNDNPFKLKDEPQDAMISALAFWGMKNISSVAKDTSSKSLNLVTERINPHLEGLKSRTLYLKNSVEILNVNFCSNGSLKKLEENGTVVLVSGTEKIMKNDPVKTELKWMMNKTSVYKNMSLQTFKKLKNSHKLPIADYVTYLSRDTHQVESKKLGALKHSDKRFGKYNEIPPGEYYLVPKVSGQTYEVYVIDNPNKSADSENGIEGIHGARGGVAIHHYSPRFSVGCFTFNSGSNTTPVNDFIKQVPDLYLGNDKPVRFILEPREVIESVWKNPKHGTKKWTGK